MSFYPKHNNEAEKKANAELLTNAAIAQLLTHFKRGEECKNSLCQKIPGMTNKMCQKDVYGQFKELDNE